MTGACAVIISWQSVGRQQRKGSGTCLSSKDTSQWHTSSAKPHTSYLNHFPGMPLNYGPICGLIHWPWARRLMIQSLSSTLNGALRTKPLTRELWRHFLSFKKVLPKPLRKKVSVASVWKTPPCGAHNSAFTSSDFIPSQALPTSLVLTPICYLFPRHIIQYSINIWR